jgi:hypothetical protein
MAICQKIVSANSQPSGGKGVVSIAGAKGLYSSNNPISDIANKNIVSPFPPYEASQLDQTVSVINNKLDTRFDDVAYYFGVDGGVG